MHIPDHFSSYTGYKDFKRKREKEAHLSAEGLHQHIEQLSIIFHATMVICQEVLCDTW